MKILVIAIIFIMESAIADTYFYLKSHPLNSPFYENLDELFIETNIPNSNIIKISFVDKNNEIKEISSKRFHASDYKNCSVSSCHLSLGLLPLSLKRSTCKIKINFKGGESTLNWGLCDELGMAPSERFLADFTIDEYEVFQENSSIILQNIGASVSQQKLEVWAFVKNEHEEIIWSGRSLYTGDFSSLSETEILFTPPIKNYHTKLGCKAIFVIDPKQTLFERKKLNNLIEIPFGECTKTPSFEQGDRLDFIPLMVETDDSFILKVQNAGSLPFFDTTSRVKTRIQLLDENDTKVWTDFSFFEAPIFGFFDEKEIYQKKKSFEWCKMIVEINPDYIFKESNYLNNRKTFDYCL